MRIQSSTVAMDSRHTQYVERTHQETLEIWTTAPIAPASEAKPTPPASALAAEAAAETGDETLSFEPSPLDKLKVALIEKLLEAITGKRISIDVPEDLEDPASAKELRKKLHGLVAYAEKQRSAARPSPETAGESLNWGLRYESTTRQVEHESSAFSATGVIQTADGKEIAFSVDLRMQRSFMSEETFRFTAGNAKLQDPLVINFDGRAAELTQTKFSFDLDADGEDDQISFLKPGSGFLVLDRNGDGRVNDGSEVFGALSGDAYADLAAYDEDGNLWIDENDAIFSRLRIWTKDEAGNDRLFALGEKGIGALYLGAVATPFALKDSQNTLHGQVRRTGLFLFEDGRAGTMQQIDLAV